MITSDHAYHNFRKRVHERPGINKLLIKLFEKAEQATFEDLKRFHAAFRPDTEYRVINYYFDNVCSIEIMLIARENTIITVRTEHDEKECKYGGQSASYRHDLRLSQNDAGNEGLYP